VALLEAHPEAGSQALQAKTNRGNYPLRILDVGCGRGWMTRLAGVYGQCDGLDPVKGVIELARSYFPDLTFHTGEVDAFLKSDAFAAYDVLICSEVIEHVMD
jgi:2-polyprenyl-3-methyl-5-hydroxy-6-metoxy-1,4-benzoquinol methylase